MALLAAGALAAAAGRQAQWPLLPWCGGAAAMAGVLLGLGALVSLISLYNLPLSDFYQPDEHPASPDDIASLSQAARGNPELHAIVAAWWQQPALIRKRDVELAMTFVRACQL